MASFCEYKVDLYKWNLFAVLGFDPKEKNGIGEIIYTFVSKKLDLGTIDFRSLLDEPDERAGIAGVAVSPDQANLLVVFNIPNRTRILELPMTISDKPEPNRQPQ